MRGAESRDRWLSDITLEQVVSMMRDSGVSEILYKILPQNANSKNQVYLGGNDPSQFAKIPTGEMTPHVSVSKKNGQQEAVLRADLDFYWLTSEGQLARAPSAKMIYYPQYPEVRFSGFLRGCKDPPSSLWVKEKRGTEPGRLLLLGIGNGQKIIGLTLPPESPATKEIRASAEAHATYEVFRVLPMDGQHSGDGFDQLMVELCRIHRMGYVRSHRLNSDGQIVPCNAPNCNGNTLEALLGIRSNGISKPDFMGWEVKARQVPNSEDPLRSSTVTLFTPEPTLGKYVEEGIIPYVTRYGYPDRNNVPDRLNVGGIYRAYRPPHHLTRLRMVLDGFDANESVFDPSGAVLLLDDQNQVAAGWSFAKLMDHWKVKHAQAVYVPCQRHEGVPLQYRYGRGVLVGRGASFRRLLRALHRGEVYYDPGIKLEGVSSSKPSWKKRSQFRVTSKHLGTLYEASRILDACTPQNSALLNQ